MEVTVNAMHSSRQNHESYELRVKFSSLLKAITSYLTDIG